MPAVPYAHPRRQTAFRMGVLMPTAASCAAACCGAAMAGRLRARSPGLRWLGSALGRVRRPPLLSLRPLHPGEPVPALVRRAAPGAAHHLGLPAGASPTPMAWLATQVLDVLGMRNEVLLLTQPTRFRSVDVRSRATASRTSSRASMPTSWRSTRRARATLTGASGYRAQARTPSTAASTLLGSSKSCPSAAGGSCSRRHCRSASSWSSWRRRVGSPASRARPSTCSCSWPISTAWRSTSSAVIPAGRPRSRTRTTRSSLRCAACGSACT